MDQADIADLRIQNVIDGGIAIATEKVKKIYPMVPCGCCYHCANALKSGFVFCDKDCQNDYDHETQRRKDNGL